MRTSLAIGGLAAAMFLAASAVRAQQQDADPFGDPAVSAAAAAPVQMVAPADVLKMMHDSKADFVLVDTQPVEGYDDGHIPGAINYPWVTKITRFPIALPRNKTLIFYGSCPSDTSDIVKQLAEFGYFNVKIMDGGWYKWLDLKYPTAGAKPVASPPPSELSQVTPKPSQQAKPVASER